MLTGDDSAMVEDRPVLTLTFLGKMVGTEKQTRMVLLDVRMEGRRNSSLLDFPECEFVLSKV
jgi:hypothetical protein